MAGKELHTSVKSDTNHPKWNEYLNFGCVVRAEEINAHHSMYVTVRDYDQLTSDDLLVYRPIENCESQSSLNHIQWSSAAMSSHRKRLSDHMKE